MKKLLIILIMGLSSTINAQTALIVPDTLSGPNYNLIMHQDSVQFFPGNISHTYAFNSNSYLGPTLIFNKGTNVNITVNNQVGDTTTVHWHGIHVPSMWDGGPHTPILANTTWNPQFTVMDNAATYWYHPHMHMKTAEQAIKGAAGLIIVRDSIESTLMLPRKYGVDDFPIIVQCQQYDSLNQAMPRGMQDSTLLVNGARANNGDTVYVNLPAQVIRLRLLNASGERTFNFGFTGNMHFYQIASDGGLLNVPYDTTRIRLAPGERGEILLDLNGMNGQSLYLMGIASEIPMGIQGGPTMPMPSGPPMDSPLNGIDFNIMKINVVSQTSSPILTIPTSLTTVTPYSELNANTQRTIRFTADSISVMDGPFYFNDSSFNMMRVDYSIPVNSIEVWKLVNETMVAHPFHLHDEQFYILDRHGITPGPEEMGRKDVVLVPPFDSLRFITKFTDFTDSIIPYMFHCHILMHEDGGMMGQFVVVQGSTGVNELSNQKKIFSVYPNPATNIINIELNSDEITQISIADILGQQIYMLHTSSLQKIVQVDSQSWDKGIYYISVQTKNTRATQKLIKQ